MTLTSSPIPYSGDEILIEFVLCLARLPLSIERIEFLLEPLVGRFAGVDRATDGEPGSRGISPGHGLFSRLK
jgi:hypothetical protein